MKIKILKNIPGFTQDTIVGTANGHQLASSGHQYNAKTLIERGWAEKVDIEPLNDLHRESRIDWLVKNQGNLKILLENHKNKKYFKDRTY